METLDLLKYMEKNARADITDLAAILNEEENEIKNKISELENSHIICGYHTVINWDKTNNDQVTAIIEVKAVPERETGYDNIASRIYQYDEVDTCYLMSGSCEFMVVIKGKTMQEVANFVGRKLAPIHGVTGTTTHFVLKCYKFEGVSLTDEKISNERMLITP